jgi:hypothetical protein
MADSVMQVVAGGKRSLDIALEAALVIGASLFVAFCARLSTGAQLWTLLVYFCRSHESDVCRRCRPTLAGPLPQAASLHGG